MTVIFRQRIFSKRWKIRKDWDVGLHHTTATIVEDSEQGFMVFVVMGNIKGERDVWF